MRLLSDNVWHTESYTVIDNWEPSKWNNTFVLRNVLRTNHCKLWFVMIIIEFILFGFSSNSKEFTSKFDGRQSGENWFPLCYSMQFNSLFALKTHI